MEPTIEMIEKLAWDKTEAYLDRFVSPAGLDKKAIHDTLAEAFADGFMEGYQTKGSAKKLGPIQKMNKAYVHEVIVVTAIMGDNTEDQPLRNVKLYFTKDGAFIGEAPDWLRPGPV